MKLRLDRWKKRPKAAEDMPQNDYYESLSARLGIFQVILYLSLLAFVVLSVIGNAGMITYRNFYYFFKDLNASVESVDVLSTDSVTYQTAKEQSFTLYRKGLAVAGNRSVTAFTATGRQTLSQTINYKNPVAVGTGRYLLVYELGGTQYSLYNSYTQIHEGKSEYPIYGACVSDAGMYALISRSEQYTSTVSLYSSNFSLLNRYNKSGYVMDVAIHEKGTLLAILTSSPRDGFFETAISLHMPKSGEMGTTVPISDSVGLSCSFTDGKRISVLCTDSLVHLNEKGETTDTYSFAGREPICARLTEYGTVMALKGASIDEKNHVLVFDKSGKIVYNELVGDAVRELDRTEDSVIWLTSSGLTCLDLTSKGLDYYPCDTDEKRLLAVTGHEAMLCSPQKAEYIRFFQS